MEKIFALFIEKGDAHTVLWLSIAIVLSVIYGLTMNKSIFWMMISGIITFLISFSGMSLTEQIIVFLAIYLCLYLSAYRNRQNKSKSKLETKE